MKRIVPVFGFDRRSGLREILAGGKTISPCCVSTIDLIRWVSALLVLLYHVRLNIVAPWADVPAESRSFILQVVYAVTSCGDQAVLFFFIVSGFLVGGSIIGDVGAGRFDGRRYLINRVARIYAVLIPALVIGYMLDGVRVLRFGLSASAGLEIAESYNVITIVGNIFNTQGILVPTLGSNIPLWSLAFEFFYYLSFPPLILAIDMAVRRRFFIPLLAIVLTLCWLARATSGLVALYFVWLLGALVRIAPAPLIRSQAISWGLAVAACFAYPYLSLHSGFATKLIVGACFANVLLCARFVETTPAPNAASFHQSASAFSYSLYLIHAPALHFILCFVFDRRDPALGWAPVGWTPFLCGGVLAAFLVCYAFLFSLVTEARTAAVKRWIEALVRAWPKRLRRAK